MTESQKRYEEWFELTDDETRKELLLLKDDAKEIEERFYRDLDFGTGGLRGIMGVGTNRMNKYTVRKTSKGLANFLLSKYPEAIKRGVIIAYDSRHNSGLFAREAANILCDAEIPVKLFNRIEPTPVLSFAIKYFHALAGIVITASHNPKEYNGYKVYDENGTQLVPRKVEMLVKYINVNNSVIPDHPNRSHGLLTFIGDEIEDLFVDEVIKQSLLEGRHYPLKIVYTPIHGAGNSPIRKVLHRGGFSDVHVVKEQESPDGDFTTVSSPNPEEKETLAMGVQLGEKILADIVLGTDPDSDRIGVGVKTQEGFKLLTGNQIGALLVNFVLEMRQKDITQQTTIIKTVVTGELGADIAREKGVQVVETLTGFKYIGEKITQYANNNGHVFLMGYEESYGFLVGTHAQDKDAVVTALLISEMAAYYKKQKLTLFDVLHNLYKQYGYYYDELSSYTLKGKNGVERIQQIMSFLRQCDLKKELPDIDRVTDYSKGINGLPKENLLKIFFLNGSWLAIRPSGTEPKIKIYFSIKESDEKTSTNLLLTYKNKIEVLLNL